MTLCEREGECLNELSLFESKFLCYLDWDFASMALVLSVRAMGSLEDT